VKLRKSFLKDIDNVSADKISENYPAEWNMDKVFEASYRKYLELKKNTASEIDLETAVEGDILEFTETENVRKHPVFRIFTMNKIIAAVCAAAVILIIKMAFIPSKNIEQPPDIIEQNPISSQEKRTTSAKEKDVPISAVLYSDVSSADNTVCTTAALETDVPAITTSDIEVSETYYDDEEYSEQTEAPIQTDVIETTEAESSQTTVSTQTESQQTTEIPTTTVSPDKGGYFQINKGSYHNDITDIYEDYDELIYVPPLDAPEEKKIHGMDSEKFSIYADNSDYNHSMKIKSEESGHTYLVYTYDYDEFSMGWTPKFKHYFEYFEINGRPALYENDRLQSDEQYDYILLMWDDGCHVSFMFDLQMYYDEMLELAECF